jgi:hypothetical protein
MVLWHVISRDLVSDPVGVGLGDCVAVGDELYCLAFGLVQDMVGIGMASDGGVNAALGTAQ